MRTGVAVTWGGFEFPNSVQLQPVNISIIPVLSEEKKNPFNPQNSKWQHKNEKHGPTFISETSLVALKCLLMAFQGSAATPQWFEISFLADSQLANKGKALKYLMSFHQGSPSPCPWSKPCVLSTASEGHLV